ncbi:hypothetical protein ARZXY2_1836 [Arthrobacter sp. ZXY-2]|nr:hypothetical protein ARZXY2_1836 [Arthrobacter sp. ZXY-2]
MLAAATGHHGCRRGSGTKKARNPWIPGLALVRGGGLEPPPPFED